MILLNGRTLTAQERFTPDSLSLNLQDGGVSTATMTLNSDAPELDLGQWLQDDTEPGKGIVWRVKTVERAYETDIRTVQLEHIVATLRDGMIFGDLGDKNKSITAKEMVRSILAKQSIWTLGSFEFDRSLPYSVSNTTLYQALERVCETLEDSRWEYDLTKLPFRLSIVKKSAAVDSEMRASRNLTTIRRTVDTSGMYTRFYPVGARNLHINGDYVSKNEGTYGAISRTETDQSITSETMLREWALHKLRRHCEPTVTIAIKGLDLSQDTGEPLDKLTLGRKCRVPLPEYGTTITQYIVRLSWADKIKAPEDVTVTLSNHRTDATTNLAQMLKQMSSSHGHNSGGSAKAAEEDHAWIVDTTDKVGLVAEAIIGRDPEGKAVDWSRVSEIIVDGEGIHQRVTATEGELVVAEARLEINENAITAEVTRATDAEGELSSRLSVTADAITAEVTRATDAEGELSGRLTVEADRITAEVTRATDAEGDLAGRLTVEADRITAEVTRATDAEGDLAGRLTVEADRITAEVTRATDAEGDLAGRITVEADRITAEVTRATDAEGDLGSRLTITEDSITTTVGRVTGTEDRLDTIEGSTLWQKRDEIALAAGKLHVDKDGNLVVDEGAELKVYDDGQTRSVTALAGKVRVTSKGNVLVEGADLIVKDSGGDNHSVTAVAGKFSVDEYGDVKLADGSGLFVRRDGTSIEVVDKGTVITSINASKEGVTIKAKKVDLGDYATVTNLDAANARITNFKNGTTSATHIRVHALTVMDGGEFTFHSKKFNMSSVTYVKSVSYSAPSVDWSSEHWFIYSTDRHSITPYGIAEGRLIQGFSGGSVSASTSTKYFLVEEEE